MPNLEAGIQAWQHPVPETKNGKSLLDQMGGVPAVTKWVDGFYDKMLTDKSVSVLLKKSQATQSQEVYMRLLKERTVEYLETVWGGDPWEGQDMFCAHAHLHISEELFDRAAKLGKEVLQGMKLPSDVIAQVMKEMNVMKVPMTDPGGKFHKWVDDRQKKLEEASAAEGAVDLHGMGFTTSPATVKKMQEEKRIAEERAEKMAAYKKKRLEEEKAAKKQPAKKDASSTPSSPTPHAGPAKAHSKAKAKAAPGNVKAKDAQTKGSSNDKEASAGAATADTKAAAEEKNPFEELPTLPEDGDIAAYMPDAHPAPLLRAC